MSCNLLEFHLLKVKKLNSENPVPGVDHEINTALHHLQGVERLIAELEYLLSLSQADVEFYRGIVRLHKDITGITRGIK